MDKIMDTIQEVFETWMDEGSFTDDEIAFGNRFEGDVRSRNAKTFYAGYLAGMKAAKEMK